MLTCSTPFPRQTIAHIHRVSRRAFSSTHRQSLGLHWKFRGRANTFQPFSTRSRSANTHTSQPASNPSSASSEGIGTRVARFVTFGVLSAALFVGGIQMAASGETVAAINGSIRPPTDAETLSLYVPNTPKAVEVDEHIRNHPLSVKLRNTPGMKEARPHMKIPEAMRPHNLTGGVLLGEGMIEVPPLVFADNEAELPSMYSISYLGKSICGHPGIVHGGMLATMLDEGLARACFPALPNKVGVTASLKIDYRSPCPAGRYVVLKAFTTKVEGRKAWVKGWIELLGDDDEGDGVKLVEAEALFIEPKNAGMLAKFYADR